MPFVFVCVCTLPWNFNFEKNMFRFREQKIICVLWFHLLMMHLDIIRIFTSLLKCLPSLASVLPMCTHTQKSSFSMRYLVDIQRYDENTNVWQFLRLLQYLIWTNIPVASCFKLFTFVYLKFFIKCLHDLSTI